MNQGSGASAPTTPFGPVEVDTTEPFDYADVLVDDSTLGLAAARGTAARS